MKLERKCLPSWLLTSSSMEYFPLILSLISTSMILRHGCDSSIFSKFELRLRKSTIPFLRSGTQLLVTMRCPSQTSPLNPQTPSEVANEKPSPLLSLHPSRSSALISHPEANGLILKTLPIFSPIDLGAFMLDHLSLFPSKYKLV